MLKFKVGDIVELGIDIAGMKRGLVKITKIDYPDPMFQLPYRVAVEGFPYVLWVREEWLHALDNRPRAVRASLRENLLDD